MSLARVAIAGLLMGAMMVSGCTGGRAEGRRAAPPGTDTLRSAAESAAAILNATREPGALATVRAAPVESWTGPGQRPFEVATRTSEKEPGHARRFGSITLPTALRTRPLDQYPCTSCHLGRKIVMTDRRPGDVHHDIQLAHPKQAGALCSNCHASDDVALLALANGKRATLDESYRLCADCHFAQVNAWAHGAHGKRLDGWQGRRVVMACPDCHDPHSPSVTPRTPFRAPQLEQSRGNDR